MSQAIPIPQASESKKATTGKSVKLWQWFNLEHLELVFLRHEILFLELLAKERKLKAKRLALHSKHSILFFKLLAAERTLKAKRLGIRADFYEKLYTLKLQQEQARKMKYELP